MLNAHELPAYTHLAVGDGHSTVLPDLDFEAYSEAGMVFIDGKWKSPPGATKKGLFLVGAAVYSEHPSTEVLSMAYDLKDGKGHRLWLPKIMNPPQDLFDHIAKGGLLEAWNTNFEYLIWNNVCVPKYGFPPLPYTQLRDAMAKSRAYAMPGGLENAAKVLQTDMQKMTEGKRLINKFSVPRNQTIKDKNTRNWMHAHPVDAQLMYEYNIQDIKTESALSAQLPDLNPEELEFWLNTQKGNIQGVGVRMEEVEACISILEQAYVKYNTELAQLTQGEVTEASKVAQLQRWCVDQNYPMKEMGDAFLKVAIKDPNCPPHVKRVLEIRKMIGSAGVKKVYAMKFQANKAGRLNDLFIYHGARTGRDTGASVQPQNLVKAGPSLYECNGCGHKFGKGHFDCPECARPTLDAKAAGWCWEAVEDALVALKTKDLNHVEEMYRDAVLTVSGCIRGLFTAAQGHDYICSDYSSIEAVVTACLSGEQWRIEAFKEKKDIYLTSASAITGTPYADYMTYKEETGNKHPDRQKIGKPAELGLGFGGWLNAWRQFDKSDTYDDIQVKDLVMAWRDASPMIVEMWGGQCRGKPWRPDYTEYFGLEGAAIQAVMNPGTAYQYGLLAYQVHEDVLFCKLPSGRTLKYHNPRLSPSDRWEGQVSLSFMGWNSNPVMGPLGWVRINTFGGRLMENVVQAVARDILRDAVNRIERAGYPIVLRVHDELVAEVPEGFGSVEEFEHLMGIMPEWAKGWPVRAAGGWRSSRYRKD